MRSRNVFVGLCFLVLGFSNPVLAESISQVSAKDRVITPESIETFRNQGYRGIQAFLSTYKSELSQQPSLRTALDAICQQKDCDAAQLYWYTDLERAKAVAQASGKPILSLRLLGNLDEELSCANSRFFRTVLYPNTEISQILRDRFVLHWQSVRPVPKVTIDFGDGRKLERTLTGNSIHYILDSNGRPVDALPGLYSPKAFQQQLTIAEKAFKQSQNLQGSARDQFWQGYHRDRLAALQNNWNRDRILVGMPSQPLLQSLNSNNLKANTVSPSPDARIAGRIAIGKMAPEMPILSRILDRTAVTSIAADPNRMDDLIWVRLANRYIQEARLDASSQMVMRRKLGANENYPEVLAKFERSIAQDTVRNEYLLHAQIHEWMIGWSDASNLTKLNERVYAELFLTPSSDPWLGLLPQDTYTGIAP